MKEQIKSIRKHLQKLKANTEDNFDIKKVEYAFYLLKQLENQLKYIEETNINQTTINP